MIGENIITIESLGSTNSYLQQLLALEHLPEGTLVIARNQNKGRGMQNNIWESESGLNLTFSLVLYPDFLDINHLFALNQMVSLALREALQTITGYDFKVKWPNDLMFMNEKVGGILIENNFRGNQIKYSIIGIGLNVNQLHFMSYSPNATSLKLITNKHFDLDSLLKQLCAKLQDYYNVMKVSDFAFLHQEYHRQLFRYNEEHLYKKNGVYFKGVIKGVQLDGKLLIANDFDLQQIVDIKEIQFVY